MIAEFPIDSATTTISFMNSKSAGSENDEQKHPVWPPVRPPNKVTDSNLAEKISYKKKAFKPDAVDLKLNTDKILQEIKQTAQTPRILKSLQGNWKHHETDKSPEN